VKQFFMNNNSIPIERKAVAFALKRGKGGCFFIFIDNKGEIYHEY